jgi:hypothetical protein
MNIDERIEALTQSVKQLAAIHKENEARADRREKKDGTSASCVHAGRHGIQTRVGAPARGGMTAKPASP